jgi:chromate transporter
MQDEVVTKRKWLSQEHFIDLIGATNLIPGPNSTEMTMHCGHERAGWKGLVVAGLCFIIPAVIITAFFAWAYKQYGSLPEVAPFLYGIKPAILAVIVSAMITLGRKAFKTVGLAIIGVVCAVASLAGMNEIIVLFGAGGVGILYHLLKSSQNNKLNSFLPLAIFNLPDLKIFWTFLKVGSILYGSGYVLFAFLDTELVSTGILSRKELIDAIAVGQFTPGPVFSAATFIGWQIGGLPGAIAATVGIFLPSFLFVALLNPFIPRLRKSAVMSAFLDAVNVASVAIILAICVEMGKDSIQDWRGIIIAVAGFAVAILFKNLNSAFVVLGGAVAGYLLHLI